MANQNIAFRTDASLDIGTGHVMRCLTLATALREQGANCSFICRAHQGNLLELIRQRGFIAHGLPCHTTASLKSITHTVIGEKTPAHAAWLSVDWRLDAEQTKSAIGEIRVDWLIVDHYSIHANWESALRPYCRKLMVIDDLADRAHDCDVVLDQNIGRPAKDYESWVSAHCQILVGPQYAFLRPEFWQLRQYSLSRRDTPKLAQLLITMGGVDKYDVTTSILNTLRVCPLPKNCHITVVMGPHAPGLANVRDLAAQMPWPTEVLINVTNMAQLMANSDLAISASGFACYELAALGCTMILIPATPIQRKVADELLGNGVALIADNQQGRSLEKIISDLSHVVDKVEKSIVFERSIGSKFGNLLSELMRVD